MTTPAQAALCKALPCHKLLEGPVRDFLYKEVIALNLSLNVPRMAPNQATEAVNLIMGDADYMNLKPEDFKVCFERARKGAKSYNRIDVQVIFEWLNAYCADREDAIIAHNRDKKAAFMTFPKLDEKLPPIFSEETKAKIAAIGKPKEDKPVKRERVPADDYHDEFDKLVREQDAKRVPGPVFVEYKGQLFDRQEYVNFRAEEG